MEFMDCTSNTEKSICGTIFRKTNGILLFVCIHKTCKTFEFASLIEYTIHINTHFPANNCEDIKVEKVEYESDQGAHIIKCDNDDQSQSPCLETFKRTYEDKKEQIGLEKHKDDLKQEIADVKSKSQYTKIKIKTKKTPITNNKSTGHNDIKISSSKEDIIEMKTNKKGYKYTCDYCNLQIKYKSDIVKHMKNEHFYTRMRAPLAQSTVCNFCGKLVKPSRFAVHVRSHTNNRPFKCEICDRRCFTNSHLKVHVARWHTGERKHQCETCGKKFYTPHLLRTHIRTHTGEKPFSCTICQRSFAQKGKLQQHSVIHTGATPFKCRHCDLLFSFGSSRRTHEKQIHGS